MNREERVEQQAAVDLVGGTVVGGGRFDFGGPTVPGERSEVSSDEVLGAPRCKRHLIRSGGPPIRLSP